MKQTAKERWECDDLWVRMSTTFKLLDETGFNWMECSRRRRKAKLKKRSRTSTPAADVLNVVAAYGRMNYLIHDFDGRFSFGGHWLRWCLVRVMDLRGSRARRCHLAAGFATRHEEHNNQIAEIHYFTLVTFMVSSFSSHVIIRILKKMCAPMPSSGSSCNWTLKTN